MHENPILKYHMAKESYSRKMVASIALKFNFEGSVVLHYTTLNVDVL